MPHGAGGTTMEMMIERTAEEAEKYELMSDGIVAEIEDKLFMIVTYCHKYISGE